MSTTQITKKIEDLLELEKLMEEAKAEADTLRDEIKQEMISRNTDVMTVAGTLSAGRPYCPSGLMPMPSRRSCPISIKPTSNRYPAGDSRLPDRIQERRRMLCLN